MSPFVPGGVSDGQWHRVQLHYYNKVGALWGAQGFGGEWGEVWQGQRKKGWRVGIWGDRDGWEQGGGLGDREEGEWGGGFGGTEEEGMEGSRVGVWGGWSGAGRGFGGMESGGLGEGGMG